MKKLLSVLLALVFVASMGAAAFADSPSVTISADCKTAAVYGDASGLYARIALVIDNSGASGLFVTQGTINTDGTIIVPSLMVPGLTVTAVNIALVPTLDDISSPSPSVKAMDFRRVGDPAPIHTPEPTPEETPAPTVAPTEEPAGPQDLPTAADLDPEMTVFISSSGKIHSVDNCSGMKNSREMTLAEATEAGYEFCHNCWARDVWQ